MTHAQYLNDALKIVRFFLHTQFSQTITPYTGYHRCCACTECANEMANQKTETINNVITTHELI